jgi:micrococcal nuclease
MTIVPIQNKDSLYFYRAIVKDVYDGDTITVDIDFGMKHWLMGVKTRIAYIQAPEVRGEGKEEGFKSREYLKNLLFGKEIIIKTLKDKTGKFGRLLIEIYLDGEYINGKLVTEGFAKNYPGMDVLLRTM